MPDSNLKPLVLKNLLHVVNAAVGIELFKHLYVADIKAGKEFDAMQNGNLSCAFFVSTILTMLKLIDRPHATVDTTLKTMEQAGWRKANTPVVGAVVYWPPSAKNEHIGFYLGDDTCVSNSSAKGVPVKHSLTMADGRTPTAFYVHDSLE